MNIGDIVTCKVRALPPPAVWEDTDIPKKKGDAPPPPDERFTIVPADQEGTPKMFEIIGHDTVNKEFLLLVGTNYRSFTVSKFHTTYYGIDTKHISKPFLPVSEAHFV